MYGGWPVAVILRRYVRRDELSSDAARDTGLRRPPWVTTTGRDGFIAVVSRDVCMLSRPRLLPLSGD